MRATASRLLLLAIVTAPSLAWRYDVLPALLAGIALFLAIRGRPARAGVLLGTSILSKVYPLFLIPALGVLWLAPVRVRRLAEFGIGIGVTVAAVMLPLWLLVGDQVWTFVRYQTDRGVQLESLPAGVLLLLNLGGGAPVPLSFGFGSVQVAGAPAAAYAAIQMWLTLFGFAALISLGVVIARRERSRVGTVPAATVVALAAASILLVLVTGKVFSVQYLVWLLPMAALLPRRQFWLTVLIGALSVAIHPLFYRQLIDQGAGAVLLLNVRNALVVVLLVWVVAGLVGGSSLSLGNPSRIHRWAHGASGPK